MGTRREGDARINSLFLRQKAAYAHSRSEFGRIRNAISPIHVHSLTEQNWRPGNGCTKGGGRVGINSLFKGQKRPVHAAKVNLNISEVILVPDMYIDSLGETRDWVMSVQWEGGG